MSWIRSRLGGLLTSAWCVETWKRAMVREEGAAAAAWTPADLTSVVARYQVRDADLEHSGPELVSASSQHFKASTPVVTSYPWSASIWFAADDGVNGNQVVFSMSDEATSDERWTVGFDNSGAAVFHARTGGVDYTATTTNVLSNGAQPWAHIVVFARSSTDREIYLRGDAANSGTSTDNATPSGLDNTLAWALESSGGVAQEFDGSGGRIDVWDSAPAAGSASDTVADLLYKGYAAATAFGSDPLHTWFHVSTDGSDSGTGGVALSAVNTPGTHDRCYVWRDSVGTYHMVNTTNHSQPPFYVADANGSGYPGIDFRAGHHLTSAANGSPVSAAPLTAWAVGIPDAVASGCFVDIGSTGTDNNYWDLNIKGSGGGQVAHVACRTTSQGVNNSNTTTSYTVGQVHLFTMIAASSTSRTCRLDGGGSGTNTAERVPLDVDHICVGSQTDGTAPASKLDGQILEVVITSRDSTDEEADMESYVSDTYGVTIA